MALLRKRFSDSPESDRDSGGHRLQRLARAVLVLLAPIAALIVYLTALALGRARALRWWWVALPAGAIAALGLWEFGWGPLFLTGWRETGEAVWSAGIAMWGKTAIMLLAERWASWLLAQVPLSLALGVCIGACLAGRRALRAPHTFREEEAKALPYKRLIAKLAKLPLWPQPELRPDDSRLARIGGSHGPARSAAERAERWARRGEGPRPWAYAELLARYGVSEAGNPYDVRVGALSRQMLIDGATGVGKTTFIIEHARGLLEAPAVRAKKFPFVFVTMKPDPDITSAFAGICERTGRKLHIVTENGRRDATARYNPIGRGTANEVAEYVLATEHAREPFNQTFFSEGSTKYTSLAVRALFELAETGRAYKYSGQQRVFRRDMWHLAYLHSLPVLKAHTEAYSPSLKEDLGRFLAMKADSPVLGQFCVEMSTRLDNFVSSDAGDVVAWDADSLDLEQAIRDGDVVVFNLDPMRAARAARSLAFYAIQELTVLCSLFGLEQWGIDPGTRKRERTVFFLIDEFSALGGSQLGTLYDRARSYGFGIGLSVTNIATLEAIGPDFRSGVVTNANAIVLFRQRESAEAYAQLLGTRLTVKETQQILEDVDLLGSQTVASGQGTLRETREHIVHPDTLRNLRDGQVCVLIGSEYFGAERRIDIVTLRNSDPEPGQLPAPLSHRAETPAPEPEPVPSTPVPPPAAASKALPKRRPSAVEEDEPMPVDGEEGPAVAIVPDEEDSAPVYH